MNNSIQKESIKAKYKSSTKRALMFWPKLKSIFNNENAYDGKKQSFFHALFTQI